MTIIFSMGDEFWIESHKVVRASIAASTRIVNTITLDKPGFFLGGSCTIDSNSSDGELGACSTSLTKTGSTKLDFGDFIESFLANSHNETAGAVSFGCHILIFLRGRLLTV